MRHWIKAALLVFLISAGSCQITQPVEVGEPTDLKIESMTGQTVKIKISLPIKNPNIFRIKVTRIQADALINDVKAGEITSQEAIKLSAGTNKVHDLRLKVKLSELIGSGLPVMEIMRKGKVDLSIKGSLTASSFLYNKEFPFARKKTLQLNR